MTNRPRPRTITDFRLIGARKLRRPATEAAELHAARTAAKLNRERDATRKTLVQYLRTPAGLRGRMFEPKNCDTLELPDFATRPETGPEHSRKRNWTASEPSTRPTTVLTLDRGRYSSRVTFTHYEYTHAVECWACVVSPRYLYSRIDTRDGLQTRTHKAPRGWTWELSDLGIVLIANDRRDDYHPSADDLLTRTPAELAKIGRSNGKLRRQADRAKKQAAKARARCIKTLTVSMQDSRRVGNCQSGAIQFAKQLGKRVDLRNPYQQIPARWFADSDRPEAQRAIDAAIERATLVTI